MSFFELSKERLGIGETELLGCFRATIFGDKGVHIEGHRGLVVFRDDEIVFRAKKCRIRVLGTNLKVRSLTESDAYVSGVIKGVEREGING